MIKAGVKLMYIDGPPPYRSAAFDAKTSACATAALAEWRTIGQSITMLNPGDGVCPTYDGMRAAARINLLEMQQEERDALVVAKNLLEMMTLCPPTNTPMELFLDGTWVEHDVPFSRQRYWMRPADGAVRTRFFSFSDDVTREAVAALERHALIEIDGDNGDQLAMHQLMALAVRAELEVEVIGSRPGVEDVIALLAARYGSEENEDVGAEEFVAMRLIGDAAEHVVAKMLELIDGADVMALRLVFGMLLRLACVQEVVTSDAANMDRLLVAAGGCLQRLQGVGCIESGNMEWRLQLYKAAVSGVKGDHDAQLSMLQVLEESHAATPRVKLMSATLNYIGAAFHAKGEHDKAVEYYTRALDFNLERLGPRHPDVATSLGCIGDALYAKDEHDKALEYNTRALDIQLERLGPRHPEVATSLCFIGTVFKDKGEHDKAVEYYTRALDIYLERLGPRHPNVAASLGNIGDALYAKGEHDKALEYFTRALDIQLRRLGPRHPHVASLLNRTGGVLNAKGEHDQALEYYTRALDIYLERLGPRHPEVATSLCFIGTVYGDKGEHLKALEYYTRALDIYLERLGPRHPHVASSLNSIGGVWYAKGKHDQALEYYTRALDIYLERLGPRHPEVATSLNSIGNALKAKDEHDKALEYYTRALDIYLERLGPRHPHVAISLNNIGGALKAKDEHDKAVEYYTRALDIYLERLGPRHPEVATSLHNIGTAFGDKGKHDKALEYCTRALNIRLETLGVHPYTASSFFDLSFPLMRLHQPAAAADCIICALQMLVSNPAFESQVIDWMKRAACRFHVIVQAQRCSAALPFLPALDRIAFQAGDDAKVCLYTTAAAEVYRQCDMPSHAAAAMRRAAAMMRRVDCSIMHAAFGDAGLELHPEGLDRSAQQLERHVQSEAQRGVHDPDPPPTPAHAPPLPALPLPVRMLAY